MNILFLGDIVGKSGVNSLVKILPKFKQDYKIDFVVTNGENAADGYGILPSICEELFSAGVDVITSGNHIWDKSEIIPYIARSNRLLRPLNYPEQSPGSGSSIYNDKRGRKILVINIMCQLFMEPLDNPFIIIEKELNKHNLGENVSAIIVDVHGEASSEKIALANHLDGKVSIVIGTHTHVPTSDLQILPFGTTYQTDAGMCGDYDSVIGGDKILWMERFRRKMPVGRIYSSQGEASLCGVLTKINSSNGLTVKNDQIIMGGKLVNRLPDAKSY